MKIFTTFKKLLLTKRYETLIWQAGETCTEPIALLRYLEQRHKDLFCMRILFQNGFHNRLSKTGKCRKDISNK